VGDVLEQDLTAHDPEVRPARRGGSRLGDEDMSEIARALSVVAARLASSEENFRTFFEVVDDILLVGSLDGKIIYANRAITRKLGYSPGDLRSMPLLALHPPEFLAEAEEIYAAMWRGERDSCPLPLRAADGRIVPVETRVWFGRWNDEDCVYGICKDLTVEQEALQRLDRVFQLNPSPMAVSTIPGRAFTDVNDAWLRTVGYDRSEVIGRTSDELDLFVDPEQQRRVGDQLAATGRVKDVDLRIRRRDGRFVDGLFSGEIITTQGRQFFLTVMLDQTERKRALEAAAREADRADKARLRALEVAHDIRDLLAAISSGVQSLRATASPGGLETGTLDVIADATVQGQELAAQLLALAAPRDAEA
jgi:PAS domain S-box-containing protein